MDDLPGFRFFPTEEELVSFYLSKKLDGGRGPDFERVIDRVVPVLDIYEFNPWELPRTYGGRHEFVSVNRRARYIISGYRLNDLCVCVCLCRVFGGAVPRGSGAVVLLHPDAGERGSRREAEAAHDFRVLESHRLPRLHLLLGESNHRSEEDHGVLLWEGSERKEDRVEDERVQGNRW